MVVGAVVDAESVEAEGFNEDSVGATLTGGVSAGLAAAVAPPPSRENIDENPDMGAGVSGNMGAGVSGRVTMVGVGCCSVVVVVAVPPLGCSISDSAWIALLLEGTESTAPSSLPSSINATTASPVSSSLNPPPSPNNASILLYMALLVCAKFTMSMGSTNVKTFINDFSSRVWGSAVVFSNF